MNQELGDKLRDGLKDTSLGRDTDGGSTKGDELADDDLADEENGGVSGGVLPDDDLGDENTDTE